MKPENYSPLSHRDVMRGAALLTGATLLGDSWFRNLRFTDNAHAHEARVQTVAAEETAAARPTKELDAQWASGFFNVDFFTHVVYLTIA